MPSSRTSPLNNSPAKKTDKPWLTPPLDFSFKQIASENDIAKHKPRKNRVGKVPEVVGDNKFNATAVWLGNNKLQTTRDAAAILNIVVANPANVAWLDLSFNQIYDIDEYILQFKGLKILYLHGNQIHNVGVIAVLKELPELRTLTLHGNPVDSLPQYRATVLHLLPNLSNLDFCHVAQSERKGVPPQCYLDHVRSERKPPQAKPQPKKEEEEKKAENANAGAVEEGGH